MNRSADRSLTVAACACRRAGRLLSALLLFCGSLSAQPLRDALPSPTLSPFAVTPDSLGFLLASPAGPDTLAATLADSSLAAADSTGFWRRLLRRPAQWPLPTTFYSPDPRPLPGLAPTPDRPAEDLADVLLPLVAGPLYDQGQLGHRQLLALDGLKPGFSTLSLDGLDLSSRITGLSDLNLVAAGLTEARLTRAWERLEDRPGGGLALTTLRARDDSVQTRVRWADGYLGFVSAEGEFQRPFLGGRALLATRQSWTHERVPGAHYRGNLFLWNWDRPLGAGWLLQADQRLLQDASEILDADGRTRRLRQSLLRGRVTHLLTDQASLGLDLWQRLDRGRYRTPAQLDDRERLLGATLNLAHADAERRWTVSAGVERQRLSSDSLWLMRRLVSRLRARAAWSLSAGPGRWVLEPAGQVWQMSGEDQTGWTAGARLGLTRLDAWGDLLLAAGQLPPTPEQLHLVRAPARLDAFTNPWLRESGLPLEPNPRLAFCTWSRQELRLGTTLLDGRAPLALRVWRVDLMDDPAERIESDSTWSWGGFDHLQWGAQLFAEAEVTPGWRARASQAWFGESRSLVSREYPSYLLDGALIHERRLYRGDLFLRVTAGLHHEFGGVDGQGGALWREPEFWLLGEASRRRFTLWWSLRNPFGLAGNARVAGRPLHGHEEWLGVRWGFVD